MRTFETGATRDSDENKPDFEGFLSPLVIERYGQYMQKHQIQADGELRTSDNWQKGLPREQYMKSAWRHFVAWWKEHRGIPTEDGIEEAICALIFNASGYLHERLKEQEYLSPLSITPNEECEYCQFRGPDISYCKGLQCTHAFPMPNIYADKWERA